MKYIAQYLKSRKEIAETAVPFLKHSTSGCKSTLVI
jgi:hypothetical protein